MILKNLTVDTILSEDLKIASSSADIFLGLLRQSNPKSLLFYTRFGIHTFGLKKPIDVVILDNQKIVRKICISLKPNRILLWNPKYNIVIELPANTIFRSKTKLNHKLLYI